RHHPEISDEQLAKEAVRRLQMPPYNTGSEDAARALLGPKRMRATRSRSGRGPDEKRCVEFRPILAAHDWDGVGQAPYGFWPVAAFEISKGKPKRVAYNSLRIWWRDHLPICPRRVATPPNA